MSIVDKKSVRICLVVLCLALLSVLYNWPYFLDLYREYTHRDLGWQDGYNEGYASGVEDGKDIGRHDLMEFEYEEIYSSSEYYDEAYSTGFHDGWQEGFEKACVYIISDMDPYYYEIWASENEDWIREHDVSVAPE